MGIFDGMNDAPTGGRRYLDAGGTYTIRVKKIGSKKADESHKGLPSFFVELEVITSDIKSCPAGTIASWSCVLKPEKAKRDMAIRNIKEFLAAAVGVMTIFDTPDPTTGVKPSSEAFADAACSPVQPFAGKLVGVRTTTVKTNAGGDFTKHTWFPTA